MSNRSIENYGMHRIVLARNHTVEQKAELEKFITEGGGRIRYARIEQILAMMDRMLAERVLKLEIVDHVSKWNDVFSDD